MTSQTSRLGMLLLAIALVAAGCGLLGSDDSDEESWVYVLFTTKENDLVRSVLPTGRARIVLTTPRDTVSRTDSNHRLLFFESELRQIGSWSDRD